MLVPAQRAEGLLGSKFMNKGLFLSLCPLSNKLSSLFKFLSLTISEVFKSLRVQSENLTQSPS